MIDDVNSLRPRMMSVAYRMLGSVADAEDAVQDAFVRYQTAGSVSSPEGFLVRTTTRLCIDGGVRAVYMTNNPDKLSRWSVAEVE
jgi:RNA polymerase sigma-70 factor (ECF subfamily)